MKANGHISNGDVHPRTYLDGDTPVAVIRRGNTITPLDGSRFKTADVQSYRPERIRDARPSETILILGDEEDADAASGFAPATVLPHTSHAGVPSVLQDRHVLILHREDDADADRARADAVAVRDVARSVAITRLVGWSRDMPLLLWLDMRLWEQVGYSSFLQFTSSLAQADPTPEGGDPDRPENPSAETAFPAFPLTDLGNAERIAYHHGGNLRFCGPWRKFLAWTGQHWSVNDTAAVHRMAKLTIRQIGREIPSDAGKREASEFHEWAILSESSSRFKAAIDFAGKESRLQIKPESLNDSPWLFNVQNGTIDLATGKFRSHYRGDMLTQISPVSFVPGATCPTWDRTLFQIFAGDEALIRFWQRLCGFCLTGSVKEQILPILHGIGANGKTTLLNVLLDVWGRDYAMKAPPELLMVKRKESHPTERASLFCKRLVVAAETGEGAKLNETLIKEFTGGEQISARRMHEDFWEFSPTHKIMLCTNHRPVITGTDHAIWRRPKLIPFSVVFTDDMQDKDLPSKLSAELSGVLNWCIQGCLDWQDSGLSPPSAIVDATAEYRAEQDILGTFFGEHCVIVGQAEAKATELYERYRRWAEGSGEAPVSQRRFGLALTERGFTRFTRNGTWYKGIGLRPAGSA